MIIAGWLMTVVGLVLTVWVVVQKTRGVLNSWVRVVNEDSKQVLGKSLPYDEDPDFGRGVLTELNAHLRNHQLESRRVLRVWDRKENESFIGLLLEKPLQDSGDFELREIKAQSYLRVSGANARAEIAPVEAVKAFAEENLLQLREGRTERFSGQSFSVLQFPLESEAEARPLTQLAEATQQLRDIAVFPVLLTIITIGLLLTKQPGLFALGIVSITFLSGACKFVFLHQRSDESQEVHLQNY